jgi:tetratricopeptide (TPR) repeat protein
MFVYEKGDQETAEGLFATCLENYPKSAIVVSGAMSFYDKIGQKERATEALRGAVENTQDPSFAKALVRRMGTMGDEEEQERLLRSETEERPSATSWFALGDFYTRRERYEEACTAFEQAVESGRNPPPTLLLAYADTLIQAERYEDAKEVTERIEDEALRALLEGRIALGEGDPAAALKSFEAGIRLWPDNPAARFLAAEAAEQLGNFDRAISEYRESVRSDARATNAGCRLGKILIARNNAEAATIALSRHAEAHPKDAECAMLLIRLSHIQGAREGANRGLRRIGAMPEYAALVLAERMAIIAAGAGPEVAVNVGQNSGLDLTAPENSIGLGAVVKQLASLGDHDKAKELVEAALAANPDAAAFHAISAELEQASGGSREEARKSLDVALGHDPEHVESLLGMASLTAGDGETDAAVAIYDRAIAADPTDPRATHEAAVLLESSGKLEEAARRLTEHLEISPLDVWAVNRLAQILAEQGEDLDRALEIAKRADYFGAGTDTSETLGWVLLLRGEAGPALKVLTRAVERHPDASSARYRLGLAHAAQGDVASAREMFLHVIEVGAPEAEQARAEIDRLDAAAS